MNLYSIARPLLFTLDPEDAHDKALKLLKRWPALITDRTPCHQQIPWRVPIAKGFVGLAAGADKNAEYLSTWQRMGFGSVEVGTVTSYAYEGNENRPRIVRNQCDESLYNTMGLPNKGFDVVRTNISKAQVEGLVIPVGLNIGSATVNSGLTNWIADIGHLYRRLAFSVIKLSHVTINISCPNISSESLQNPEGLADFLSHIDGYMPMTPKYLKLPCNIESSLLYDLAEVAVQHDVEGFVAFNSLPTPQGGLSGRPLWDTMLSKIGVVFTAAPGAKVIGCGGVDSPEKAEMLMDMGCSSIQLYTGLIYKGPQLIHQINEHLEKRGYRA